MYIMKKILIILFKPKKLKDFKSPPLYLCNNQLDYVNNLNHTVLTCTVHNSGMILLKPFWKNYL